MQEYLKRLNEKQREAVTDTDGYVLVFAGAGSGKTRVLTTRIAHLLVEGKARPDEILAITFTNKAADEMRERLSAMGIDVDTMWVSTIHSMCVRILRSNIGRLPGYDRNFTIYDETDKSNVLKRIIKRINAQNSPSDDDEKSERNSKENEKILKRAKALISDSKNKDIGPETFRFRNDIKDLNLYANIYLLYEEELHKANALDFDDLLLKTFHLLDEDQQVLDYYRTKFKYIHIDEFQDTNAIQMDIAKLLSSYHKNLFVVGDDDQSIYGWRGAEIRNILDFENNFKGAKVHKLEQNYRSTKNILNLANTIIKSNSERKSKNLWTENGDGEKVEVEVSFNESKEAEYTAFNIKRLMSKGAKAGDFAVLMRINALSHSFEQEFRNYNIPYKVFGGFKFYERKEIKDLLAYMRILCNPLDNESILRVINIPRRGIGDKTIVSLIDYANKYGLSVYDGIVDSDKLGISAMGKGRLNSFREIINSLMLECENKPLSDIFECIVNKTTFMSQFEADTEENYSKRMNIDQLQNDIEQFAKRNKDATLADFLNSVTLSSDTDELEEGNYVTLATIHSVKGLEFKNVFICGLDETFFPISRAVDDEREMEEERRLMYVAITRAQEKLFLTRAQSRFYYGERQYTAQSRFLTELSDILGLRKPVDRSSYGFSSDDYGYQSDSFDDDYSYSGGGYKGNRNNYGGYNGSRNNYGGYNSNYNSGYNSNYNSGYSSGYGNRNNSRNNYNNYNPDYGSSDRAYPSESYGSSSTFKSHSFVKPQEKPKEKSVSGFKQGAKVEHPKFGKGTIILIKGEGKNTIADVAFPGVGIKSLALAFAPLKVVE